MRNLLIPLIFAVGIAGCTPTPAETARAADRAEARQMALAKRLKGLVPGPPRNCIDNFQTRDAQVSSYGDTILYALAQNVVYRSDTAGGCTGLGSAGNNILVTRTFTSQLCQGDIATTVDNTTHFQNGACSFGPFVRYAKPGR